MSDEQHAAETERLWQQIRRDLNSAILFMSGASAADDPSPVARLDKNWLKLCEHDLDFAAAIHHGLEQIEGIMARRGKPTSPSDHRLRSLAEVAGLAEIARERYPDAGDLTVGELVRLAQDAIAAEIDDETDPR